MIRAKCSSSAISQRTVMAWLPSVEPPNNPVCTSRVHNTTASCVGEPLATPSANGLLSNRAWLQALRGSHRVVADAAASFSRSRRLGDRFMADAGFARS
jgi:hypothetical protein